MDVVENYIREYVSKTVTETKQVLVETLVVDVQIERQVYSHSTWGDYQEWESVKIGTVTEPQIESQFSHWTTEQEPLDVPVYVDVEVTVIDTVVGQRSFCAPRRSQRKACSTSKVRFARSRARSTARCRWPSTTRRESPIRSSTSTAATRPGCSTVRTRARSTSSTPPTRVTSAWHHGEEGHPLRPRR